MTLPQKVQIANPEKITLTNKAGGGEFVFYIGQEEGSDQWLAFTENSVVKNLPHFCIECDNRDDAYHVGVVAYQLHFKGFQ